MRATTRIRPLVLAALLVVAGLTLYTGYAPLWRLLLLILPLALAGYIWVKLGLRGIEVLPAVLPERSAEPAEALVEG